MTESDSEGGGVECPYCGDNFVDDVKKGVHMAEEHVERKDSMPEPKRKRYKNENKLRDWKKNQSS